MASRGGRRLSIITASLVLSLFIAFFLTSKVFAVETTPNCSDGIIEWNNLDSTFDVTLNCENLVSFFPTDPVQTILTSESANIGKIELSSSTRDDPGLLLLSTPIKAEINLNKLRLSFISTNYFFSGSLKTRDVKIASGVIFNSFNQANDIIEIPTINIVDFSAPYAENDYYQMSGENLIVAAEKGLPLNDQEAEGTFGEINIIQDPGHGVVSKLLADGSFVYTPDVEYFGNDSFTYAISDDSGNISNEATVNISDDKATIDNIKFINLDASGEVGYAKLGDALQLSFETNEPVSIDEIKIAGQKIDSEQIIDNSDTHFVINYTLKATDIEGIVTYSIGVIDRAGNKTSSSAENGIIFDMTVPEILPDMMLAACSEDNPTICLEINEPYNEPNTIKANDIATDGTVSSLKVAFIGSVNVGQPGDYRIDYCAIDRAGNEIIFTRIIRIVDSVNDEFTQLSNDLNSQEIKNNLSLITTNNRENFSDIFFEKSISGQKMVRITFNGPVDISVFTLAELVSQISDKLSSAKIGSVDLNFEDFDGLSAFISDGVIIKLYNLNLLGYSSANNTKDVVNKLDITDGFGKKIDITNDTFYDKKFYSCGINAADCYYFEIAVKQLFKYDIGIDDVAPKLTINGLGTTEYGDIVILSGLIDDLDAKLTLKIGDNIYNLSSANINGLNWSFLLDSSLLSIGDYQVQILAVDFVGNQSTAATSLRLKNTSKKASLNDDISSAMVKIFLQSATIEDRPDQAVSSTHILKQNEQVISSVENINIFETVWFKALAITSVLSMVCLIVLFIIQRYLKRK